MPRRPTPGTRSDQRHGSLAHQRARSPEQLHLWLLLYRSGNDPYHQSGRAAGQPAAVRRRRRPGRAPGGETASRLALDTLSAAFTGTPTAQALAAAFRQAGRAVWERAGADPALHGMGTTLTAVALLQNGPETQLAVASLGDSRACLFQDRQLRQLTRDDSVVQGLIDAGQVAAGQWRTHPDRSLLTRALGIAPVTEPELTLPSVTGHARLLLCTDGLTAQVDDTEIIAILSGPADPAQVASDLIDLANNNGGADNTAVIVVDL